MPAFAAGLLPLSGCRPYFSGDSRTTSSVSSMDAPARAAIISQTLRQPLWLFTQVQTGVNM